MLILPAEPADTGLPRSFDNRDVDHDAADTIVGASALVSSQVNEGLVRYRFHKAVPQQVHRDAVRPDRFAVRYTFLNLNAGEGSTGANRPIVHQCSTGNDLRTVSDWNVGILKPVVRAKMSHPQLDYLAATSGYWALVALPAGLGIIEWT